MNKKLASTAVAAGVIMAVAFAGPAFASTPSGPPKAPATLASVQAKGAAETAKRVTALHAALTRVDSRAGLSSADKATITARFTEASAGETALGVKIAADTTLATAKADLKSVYAYRVYAVLLPQAHIAEAATISTTRLSDQAKKLTARLAGKDKSKSTDALQADLADVTTQIAIITSKSTGLAASALAVTAAQYDANHAVLNADKAAAKAIRSADKRAHADLKAVRAALTKVTAQ